VNFVVALKMISELQEPALIIQGMFAVQYTINIEAELKETIEVFLF